jgi:hypothetical protein
VCTRRRVTTMVLPFNLTHVFPIYTLSAQMWLKRLTKVS